MIGITSSTHRPGLPDTRPPPSVSARPARTTVGVTGVLSARSIQLSALPPLDRGDPVVLQIPALGLRAPVQPVGTDPVSRLLLVPASTTVVAWWAYGARPGDPTGTVVLAAHVDYNGILGVFARLTDLPIGATARVLRSDGSVVVYRVTGRWHVAKARLASLGLFRDTGPPLLVLITCGGPFDPAARSYVDNVVVTAAPTGVPSRPG